ncbi:hypothetical protein CEXT_516191 [Caerostris extrusa]|uniref:Uncharacterized protein n=1 Tax=Caerostris extrusa TaxID=172846 RepID=A0AAV4NBE6_CAEEX|nr:hypothetical protein CEXT_516191 [Caerostris extrusa]
MQINNFKSNVPVAFSAGRGSDDAAQRGRCLHSQTILIKMEGVVQWTPIGNEISGQEDDLVVTVGDLNGNIGGMYRIVLQVAHTMVGTVSNDAPEEALFAQPNDTDKDGRGGRMDPPRGNEISGQGADLVVVAGDLNNNIGDVPDRVTGWRYNSW